MIFLYSAHSELASHVAAVDRGAILARRGSSSAAELSETLLSCVACPGLVSRIAPMSRPAALPVLGTEVFCLDSRVDVIRFCAAAICCRSYL
jgi:hypothetical protein